MKSEWKKNQEKKNKEFSLTTQIIIVLTLWLPLLWCMVDVATK